MNNPDLNESLRHLLNVVENGEKSFDEFGGKIYVEITDAGVKLRLEYNDTADAPVRVYISTPLISMELRDLETMIGGFLCFYADAEFGKKKLNQK